MNLDYVVFLSNETIMTAIKICFPILPIFVLIFAILYIIMVNAIVIGMFIDWIVCTFKKSMI